MAPSIRILSGADVDKIFAQLDIDQLINVHTARLFRTLADAAAKVNVNTSRSETPTRTHQQSTDPEAFVDSPHRLAVQAGSTHARASRCARSIEVEDDIDRPARGGGGRYTTLVMPSSVANYGTTVKLVSVPNPAQTQPTASAPRGLPATTVVVDESTGAVKAVVNARALSIRTALGKSRRAFVFVFVFGNSRFVRSATLALLGCAVCTVFPVIEVWCDVVFCCCCVMGNGRCFPMEDRRRGGRFGALVAAGTCVDAWSGGPCGYTDTFGGQALSAGRVDGARGASLKQSGCVRSLRWVRVNREKRVVQSVPERRISNPCFFEWERKPEFSLILCGFALHSNGTRVLILQGRLIAFICEYRRAHSPSVVRSSVIVQAANLPRDESSRL